MAEHWGRNAPKETTRLLAESVKISAETETIGNTALRAPLLLLFCNVVIFIRLIKCVARRTLGEMTEQGETLEGARDKVRSFVAA